MQNNPFWRYSLAVYGRRAVAKLCLTLQDDYAADVNVLLSAAWLSSIGQPLTADLLQQLLAVSSRWQKGCIGPLRQARRFLKNNSPAENYQQAKLIELELESLLQQELYSCLKDRPLVATGQHSLKANVQRYLNALEMNSQGLAGWLDEFCQAMSNESIE